MCLMWGTVIELKKKGGILHVEKEDRKRDREHYK